MKRTIHIGVVVAILGLAAGVSAHHILGIPHYAYDEQYPQAPVLTYRADAGPYEVKMTGYPGRPQPGERCSYHVYIRDRLNGALFHDGVRLRVFREALLGDDPVVYGPVDASLEEAVYKFFPQFDHEANYRVRIEFEGRHEPWSLDLPIVVGEPGNPWAVLGGFIAGLTFLIVVVRAIHIKRNRARQLRSGEGKAAG